MKIKFKKKKKQAESSNESSSEDIAKGDFMKEKTKKTKKKRSGKRIVFLSMNHFSLVPSVSVDTWDGVADIRNRARPRQPRFQVLF